MAAGQVILAFGGLGHGAGHIHLNGTWIAWLRPTADAAKQIIPGRRNHVPLACLNKEGPGGLMGRVKLLVREKKRAT